MAYEPETRPTPLDALWLDRIPTELHFRRDHFPPPDLDPASFALEVGGAVERPLRLGLEAVMAMPERTLRVVLECAGHRRTEFDPPAEGVSWGLGAVGEAAWTGTALAGVLGEAGVSQKANAIVLEGGDRGVFPGVPGEVSFGRGVPIAKALHPDTLLVWAMNGEPLPHEHGAPLRAIVPGWYATDSVKWLTSVEVIEGAYGGAFEALDYRLPDPDSPGGSRRMTGVAVHAIATSPTDGAAVGAGPLELQGIAWGGEGGISKVEISVDGEGWRPCCIVGAEKPYGRTRWEATAELSKGAHRIAVRATDGQGRTQPEALAWNPRGYGNATIHRIDVITR